jgi:hypothetical protein
MDFSLIPICSEIKHDLIYNYKEDFKCDICGKKKISYQCKNCEYSRCKNCHHDYIAQEEISERIRLSKLKNDIKISEKRLKKDGLNYWDVMVTNGEICFVNKLSRTYSYDYPLSIIPDPSPISYKEQITPQKESTMNWIINGIQSLIK